MKQHPIYKDILVAKDGLVIKSTRSGKILKQGMNTHGYLHVTIKDSHGNYKLKRVHRLVAETYHGIKEGSWDVHHIDHCKTNNNADNVMWATRSENVLAAIDHGVNPSRGETHPNAEYSDVFIKEVCQKLQDGWRNIDIEKDMGIDRHHIGHIKKGTIWSHISCRYKFNVERNKRISLKTIKAICELLQEGKSCKEVSKSLNVTLRTVQRIFNKTTHSSVSKDYSF